MTGSLLAGLISGFVLGFLGAGGTVVGLPFLLLLTQLQPHIVLGTNALGVCFIAAALLIWRIWKKQILLLPAVIFTIPGLIGDFIGSRIGLAFPGQKLIFLLGWLLFIVAGWLFYLSLKMKSQPGNGPVPEVSSSTGAGLRRMWLMIPTALIVGTLSGFFAIGGGFMIVPAIALTGDLDLITAAGAGLLPITAFAGFVGLAYLAAGSVNLQFSLVMLVPGLLGGILGIRLGQWVPKKLIYRIFAVFLVLVGIYMLFK